MRARGAEPTSDVPPPDYKMDPDAYFLVDAKSGVTGAGIATLQTIPEAPPGNAHLVAPHGTVDAGAAGIRVSGNLFIAAHHVENAFNIQVQGITPGHSDGGAQCRRADRRVEHRRGRCRGCDRGRQIA
jgi:Filamentous haemagglutinin family outer membrane protein